ncbi:translocon-associated protein subunit alpha [Contarinia nasturtii]|uniref:translocon-associated protein subunit alpha n=1 Tax=Contarinia nasturtii TaxID=265458 RepID=UPI0012D40B91|nr:translocon-associated protein subunit alpha [Contarinia nasturtii]
MKYFWLISLLVLPSLISLFNNDNNIFANATETAEAEDDIIDVESDDGASTPEYEDDSGSKTSPDADTYLLFTKPLHVPGNPFELPGGLPVEFLVGFLNKGLDEFVVESVEASFRYPMDFNYFIQNFSAISYNREVKSNHEATVSYSFLPSETFAGRPFGLNIALNYRDANGARFSESVFNETVQITEVDEGLDGETFFLYVFLAAIVVLLLVLGQQFLAGSVGRRKRAQVARKAIETGTTNSSDVDYEWLPQETLKIIQQSPKSKKSPNSPNGKVSAKQSPKSNTSSPRQRK